MTTDQETRSDQRKPTILIGYGRFGREVLQRLLRKSAPRGALVWDLSPHGDAGIGEHRLRDLALLHLPDGEPGGTLDTDSAPDFILDLYRQIREVQQVPGSIDQLLCDAVAESATHLRSTHAARDRRGGRGMDVLVISHINAPSTVGTLERHTGVLLQRLEDEVPDWRVTQQSERKLNAAWILDFDNYRHPDMLATRQVLSQCMGNWKQRLDQKRPALDRCWLVDGQAQDTHRSERDRIDEITAFLELLLFSGLRDDERMRELYEQVQAGPNRHVAATFGIRLLEQGSELLGRIAAARFGEGWLAYLRGDPQTGFSRVPRRIRAKLAPLLGLIGEDTEPSPDGTDGTGPLAVLDTQWQESVQGLTDRLLDLPGSDQQDWIHRAESIYDGHCRALELALNRAGLDLVRQIREELLRDGGAAIRDAITADLHDRMEPAPLASVRDEIRSAIMVIEARMQALSRRDRPRPALTATAAAHRAYLSARGEWLARSGRGLALLWPLLALTLGLALTPFAIDLLRWLPTLVAPDAALSGPMARAAMLWRHPGTIAICLGVLIWVPLATLVQRRIIHGISRARAFFTDRDRGRLADCIRCDTASLSIPLAAAKDNVRAALAAGMLQVMTPIQERLSLRDRELVWLRRQLGEFQRMQGLHAGRPDSHLTGDSCHRLVQTQEGMERMVRVKPAEPAHFQGHQEALPAPFAGWDARFCDAFLDLFPFVERLSEPYLRELRTAATEGPVESGEMDQATLADFLTHPKLGLTFAVDADKSSSESETFCVLPRAWRGDQTLARLLSAVAVAGERIRTGKDPVRLYLIRRRINIAAAALASNALESAP